MDKTKIPTTEVDCKGLKVEFYNWLTQDESQKQFEIVTGGRELDPSSLQEGKMSLSISSGILAELNRFKVEALCKNLAWEDFNVLSPDVREKVLAEADKIINKKK